MFVIRQYVSVDQAHPFYFGQDLPHVFARLRPEEQVRLDSLVVEWFVYSGNRTGWREENDPFISFDDV